MLCLNFLFYHFDSAWLSGDDKIDVRSTILDNEMYQVLKLFSNPLSVTTKANIYALGLLLFKISFLMKTDSEKGQ